MKVAVLATDGVEQVELDRPWQALEEAGAEPELVSLEGDPATVGDQLAGDPHGVVHPRSRHVPAGDGAAQQAAQLGSGPHGHVGNRSAPGCAPSWPRVAAAPWQEN